MAQPRYGQICCDPDNDDGENNGATEGRHVAHGLPQPRRPGGEEGISGRAKNCKTRSSKALVSPSTTWLASKPKPRTKTVTRMTPTSIRFSTSLAARSRERNGDMDEEGLERRCITVSARPWRSKPGFKMRASFPLGISFRYSASRTERL